MIEIDLDNLTDAMVYEAFSVDGNEGEALNDIYLELFELVGKEENKDMVLFRGTPVFDLVDVSHEVIYDLLGDPDTSMYGGEELTYGNVLLHFDMFSLDEPFLNGILSTNADDFTYNGQPIPDTYDGLTGLFGDSPKEDDHGRYCYTWRYGGRWVDLTVAPKDSSIDPGTISMSWRPQSFEEEQPVVKPPLPYGFEWVEAPYVTDDGLFQNIEGVIRNNSGAQLSYASVSFNFKRWGLYLRNLLSSLEVFCQNLLRTSRPVS